MNRSKYYQCERCGRVKDFPKQGYRRVPPLCSRCRSSMMLRVIEQLDLGLEFPDEDEQTKTGRRARMHVIEGGNEGRLVERVPRRRTYR